MENHHFKWVNPLHYKWSFSMAMWQITRGYGMCVMLFCARFLWNILWSRQVSWCHLHQRWKCWRWIGFATTWNWRADSRCTSKKKETWWRLRKYKKNNTSGSNIVGPKILQNPRFMTTIKLSSGFLWLPSAQLTRTLKISNSEWRLIF